MLQRGTAMAVILALSLVLAACGGSAEESTGGESPETPAPTQTATETPQVEPTPAENPTAEPTSGGEASETPQVEPTPAENPTAEPASGGEVSETPQAEPTPAENTSEEAVSGDSVDVAEHLSEKTMQLWEVYNKHDLDALMTFYEENYWKEQEEEIRSNMQPFRTFSITISAEETSPPTEIAPGKWEIKHIARFPLGSINMVFVYEEFGGDWLLTYAEGE